MSRDFTLGKFDELCRALVASGRPALPIVSYLETPPAQRPARFALLRHDARVRIDPHHVVSLVADRHGEREPDVAEAHDSDRQSR